MRKLNIVQLRNICIKKNWFTCGGNEEYNNLFKICDENASIEALATQIYLNSDNASYEEILEELKI